MSIDITVQAADGGVAVLTVPGPVFAATTTPPPPTPPAGAGLSAVLQMLDGTSFSFAQANATRLDDFVDPMGTFVQQCWQATEIARPMPGVSSKLSPFQVYFRPDAAGGRSEVAFELCDPTGVSKVTPAHLQGYTATVFNNGVQILQDTIPAHNWGTRWRLQTAWRPIRAGVSAATLIAAGKLPNYDKTGLCERAPLTGVFSYTPGGFAGLTKSMGTTGERPDIGPVTGWQADHIHWGRNWTTVQAQGDAINSFQIVHRDLSTGAPIDLLAYPKASSYGGVHAVGSPAITLPALPGVGFDVGHSPEACAYPAWLTGDPYLIEGQQFEANAQLLQYPYQGRYNSPSGRYASWGARTRRNAWDLSPDVGQGPGWMLTKPNFKTHSDNHLAYLTTTMSNPDFRFQTMRFVGPSDGSQTDVMNSTNHDTWVAGTYGSFWQNEFMVTEAARCVEMGLTEWAIYHAWVLAATIARANGTSGWRRCVPDPYTAQYCAADAIQNPLAPSDTTLTVFCTGSFKPGPQTIEVSLPGGAFELMTATVNRSVDALGAPMLAADTTITVVDGELFAAGPQTLLVESEQMTVVVDLTTKTWPVTRAAPVPHAASAAVSTLTWQVTRTKAVAHAAKSLIRGPEFTDWADAAAANLAAHPIQFAALPGDPTGMLHLNDSKGDNSVYQAYARGALAESRRVITDGSTDVAFAFMDGELRADVASGKYRNIDPKWAIR